MSLANMVRRMGEAGATAEAIAIAMEEIEALQIALEARRSADRDRKRRQREAQKPTNVTGHSEDSHGTVTPISAASPSLDKKPPDPEKLNPTPCVRETRARDGYHRLPEGWQPTRPLPARTQAKADQWPPGAIEDELAAMHRWAANAKNEQGKGRKRNWDTAWANWIERRHDEHYGRRHTNGLGRHQPDDGLSPTTRAAEFVFGRSAPSGVGH